MKASQSNYLLASLSIQTTFWIALLPLLSIMQANPYFSASYGIDSVGLTANGELVRGTSSVTTGLSVLREQCGLFNDYLSGNGVIYPTWITYGDQAVCAETWAQVLSDRNLGSWLPLACCSLICLLLCGLLLVVDHRVHDERRWITVLVNALLLCDDAVAGGWTFWRLTSAIPFSGVPIGIAFFALAALHVATFPHRRIFAARPFVRWCEGLFREPEI